MAEQQESCNGHAAAPWPTVNYGKNTNSTDVLIIGAGISGMTAAIDMIRKGNGRNFIIVEKGNQIGGTWNDQRYPGCCCDIFSHLYSLSFEPNPNWTRLYPGQEEILQYLIKIAEKYQLYKHVRFSSAVEEARWDDATSKWHTKVHRCGAKDSEFGASYTITSDYLISAVGQLNAPKYPDLKGLDTFKGKVMHSARWDWDYDIRGKKVGIIGNGATAVQIVPEIAKVCKKLTVFQRTPNWIIPRDDEPISPFMQGILTYVPFVRRRFRAWSMDHQEDFFNVIAYPGGDVGQGHAADTRKMLEEQLPGDERAELRDKLTPKYTIGCRRVLITDDYFPAFKRPNVVLETESISEVNHDGISTAGAAQHDLDLIVLATGFKTTQFMYPIKIYGSRGIPIDEVWTQLGGGASAYLGMTVPSLPNFSIMFGPNTNLGHNSIILMIEAQSLYINAMIGKILQAKKANQTLTLAPRKEVVEAYNAEVQTRLSNSSFADRGCNSWYKEDGSGKITNNWAGPAVEYQKRTCGIEWEKEFTIGGSGAEGLKKAGMTRWQRVVEETQLTNSMIGVGSFVAVVALVGGEFLRRGIWRLR